MSTIAEELSISTADGSMTGYAFMPEGDGPHPAVIVIQEIFGVDDHIKDVARRFAAEGYYAVAPDLFYRQGAGLTVSYDNREEAFALRATTTPEGITADLNALVAHLDGDARANSSVGIVGYCFGGGVVYLASHAVPGISAAAIYYGGGIVPRDDAPAGAPNGLDNAGAVACPVIGFWGEEDAGIPVAHVERIEAALKDAGKDVEFHVYKGAGHGFFCDGRGSYNKEASDDAWPRTLAFFKRHLGTD